MIGMLAIPQAYATSQRNICARWSMLSYSVTIDGSYFEYYALFGNGVNFIGVSVLATEPLNTSQLLSIAHVGCGGNCGCS
jgi:hypothetical protein